MDTAVNDLETSRKIENTVLATQPMFDGAYSVSLVLQTCEYSHEQSADELKLESTILAAQPVFDAA